jgi:hypothetical protein
MNMKTSRIIWIISFVLVLSFALAGCGSPDSASPPEPEETVFVTVTDKTNLPEDMDAARFSDRVLFTFQIDNAGEQEIKGIQGFLSIQDLFGEEILSMDCDFTGDRIPAGGSITVTGMGMDINQFMDEHIKLYQEDYSDLQFEYTVNKVVVSDSSNPSEVGENPIPTSDEVLVEVTNKINLPEDWDAGRFSPRVEFQFQITNETDRDIKGIQGTLVIQDMFGVEIMSMGCDFTGQIIPAQDSIVVSDLGIDINQFMDDHIKLHAEVYENLIFEYLVTSIVYQ